MAYEKTTWQSGDVVTSEKLNNIENGIASLDYVILEPTVDTETGYLHLGKSYNDFLAYYNSNKLVYVKVQRVDSEIHIESFFLILSDLTYDRDFGYRVTFGSEIGFSSDTADGELVAD